MQLNWDEVTNALTYPGPTSVIITSATIDKQDELTLKSNFNEYRKKDDLAVNTFIDLPIEHKIPTDKTYDFDCETAFVEFHEGAQLEGYAIVWNDEINNYVHEDFNITFHTYDTYSYTHRCIHAISKNVIDFWWNERTNVFYANGAVNIAVHLNSAKIVAEDKLALKSDLDEYQLKSNTTITHYCPIEETLNKIDDFVVGAPVYLTGKVYKYDKATKQFISSTESDTTDCICSVKTNGKWNEFVGICTSKDDKCITFATHGDYLVRVTDTSCYRIGDEVFVDEGELKTLTGQTAITSKIRRTTVGIITSKINDTMLSVFKA